MEQILVVRNDKIGDFMLAWPSFALLKQSCACEITALVPSYTAPLAELCPWIDRVIIDPGAKADRTAQQALLMQLRVAKFDAAITLFSTGRIAWLLWRAAIPYRLAPATKWAQLLYNDRLTQRRSRSEKPESEYNLDLVRHFLAKRNLAQAEIAPPYLAFTPETLGEVRQRLALACGINADQPWFLIHAGSGGSANNLPVSHYAKLGAELKQRFPEAQLLLTAGPGEEQLAEELGLQLQDLGVTARLYRSTEGLARFAQVIANSALFVAGSTGPLHIAGALDVPTVGFFPRRRSATPLRWRPLNSSERHLAFTPPQQAVEEKSAMSDINVVEVADQIEPWFKALIRA